MEVNPLFVLATSGSAPADTSPEELDRIRMAARVQETLDRPRPCDLCRSRRRKCDLGRPCKRCSSLGRDCTYELIAPDKGGVARRRERQQSQHQQMQQQEPHQYYHQYFQSPHLQQSSLPGNASSSPHMPHRAGSSASLRGVGYSHSYSDSPRAYRSASLASSERSSSRRSSVSTASTTPPEELELGQATKLFDDHSGAASASGSQLEAATSAFDVPTADPSFFDDGLQPDALAFMPQSHLDTANSLELVTSWMQSDSLLADVVPPASSSPTHSLADRASQPAATGAFDLTAIAPHLRTPWEALSKRLDRIEKDTLQCDYAPSLAVTYIFRRFPTRADGLAHLQRGASAVFYDEAPAKAGYHTPRSLKQQLIAIGDSVRTFADLNEPHVLLIDEVGTLQAVPTSRATLDQRTIFEQRWHTIGPRGELVGPPWYEISSDDRRATLWPSNCTLRESDYEQVIRQGKRLLSSPVASILLEISDVLRPNQPVVRKLRVNEWLLALSNCKAQLCPDNWSPMQTRYRVAILLAMLSAPSQSIGPVEIRIGEGETTHTSVSVWEFGASALELAWRLLQPRRGGAHDDSECTLEALIGVSFVADGMRGHPLATSISKIVKRLVHRRHSATLAAVGASDEQLESYRRLLGFHLKDVIAQRFWREQDFDCAFAPLLEPLGQPTRFPGELLVPENPTPFAEGNWLSWLRYTRFTNELAFVNEALLDSSLLSTAQSTHAQREADSASLLQRLNEWKTPAFDELPWLEDRDQIERMRKEGGDSATAMVDPVVISARINGFFWARLAVTVELAIASLRAHNMDDTDWIALQQSIPRGTGFNPPRPLLWDAYHASDATSVLHGEQWRANGLGASP